MLGKDDREKQGQRGKEPMLLDTGLSPRQVNSVSREELSGPNESCLYFLSLAPLSPLSPSTPPPPPSSLQKNVICWTTNNTVIKLRKQEGEASLTRRRACRVTAEEPARPRMEPGEGPVGRVPGRLPLPSPPAEPSLVQRGRNRNKSRGREAPKKGKLYVFPSL